MSEEHFDLDALNAIPDPVAGAEAAAHADRSDAAWESVAAKLGPAKTRAQLWRQRAAAIALSAVWISIAAVIAGVRDHFEARMMIVQGGVPLAIALTVGALGFTTGRLGLGARPRTMLIALLAAPLLYVGTILAFPIASTERDARAGVACSAAELLAAVVPTLALVAAYRHGLATRLGLRMALLGLGVGLFAASIWSIHCPDNGAVHVLVSHGMPAIGLATLAAVAGSALARVRNRSTK